MTILAAGRRVNAETAPSLPLMHAAFVLAGLGTLLLGPILPLLARRWHLQDSQSGLLLMAQFLGATVGGSTTSAKLRDGTMTGLICAGVGFAFFAWSPGLAPACLALLVGGFGVGRTIATVNILAGRRYAERSGSVLSWLNFSWSFGALLSPLSAAWLASRFPLPWLLSAFAAMFAAVAATLYAQGRGGLDEIAVEQQQSAKVGPALFLYFAVLLLLYGGLETSLAAWLTTYALRYGQSSLVLSEYITVLFLVGLTAGRALSAWMLRHTTNRLLQRVSLVIAAGLGGALALAHTASLIAMLAVLLGVALAPIYPATFAIVLASGPSARQAGQVLAASGLGAAALPWLMGVVSTGSGSLQVALSLPVAAAVVLLTLTLAQPASAISTSANRI